VLISTSQREPPVQAARQALLESVLSLNGRVVPQSQGNVVDVARSADGSKLAAVTASLLQLWSIGDSGDFAHDRDISLGDTPTYVTFGYGDRWVVAAGRNFICFINLRERGGPQCERFAPEHGLLEEQQSPDGRVLIGIRFSSSIVAWDLTASNPIQSQFVIARRLHTLRNAQFSGDGKLLVAWGITATELWAWKAENIRPDSAPIILAGHSSPVRSAAASGLANAVVSADEDGNIFLWDLSGSAAKHVMLVPGDGKQWTTMLDISQDGRWLAVPRRLGLPANDSEATTEILLYQMSRGAAQLRARLPHDAYTDTLSFDPTNRFLLAFGSDGTNWLWDLREPFDERRARLPGHSWAANHFAFSDDGNRLVMADTKGQASYWDLACQTPRPVASPLNGTEGPLTVLLFGSPKGWLVGGDQHNLRYWDASLPSLGEPLVMENNCKADLDHISSSSSGRWMAVVSRGTITLFDAAASTSFSRRDLSAGVQIEDIQLSPDDRWLGACSKDGDMLLWDLAHPQTDPRWRLPAGPYGACDFSNFSDDGAFLVTSDAVGDHASLWDLRISQSVPPRIVLEARERLDSFRVSRQGRYLAGLRYDTVWLWDRDRSPAVPDFSSLYSGKDVLRALRFSPDGRWLIALHDEAALLWSLPATPGSKPSTLSISKANWLRVSFSRDGRQLFIPVSDGFELWDLSDPPRPRLSKAVKSDSPNPSQVMFGQGDGWLATAEGSTVYLWDLKHTASTPTIFDSGGDYIVSVAFSPDGTQLAFGSYDGFVGMEPTPGSTSGDAFRMRAQEGSIQHVGFSFDSAGLISASYQSVRLWPTRTDQLLQLAKDRIGRNPDAYESLSYLGDMGTRLPVSEPGKRN
jgi:WD40 repeat protein